MCFSDVIDSPSLVVAGEILVVVCRGELGMVRGAWDEVVQVYGFISVGLQWAI